MRVEGGDTSDKVIVPQVVCDNARTTCWTEAEGKVESVYQLPVRETRVEFREEGIEAFLNKPYLIGSAQYTTTTAANTNLVTIQPHTLLSSVTQWANKIQGFGLVRGNFHLRVEVNAYPFQSGNLLIHWYPMSVELAATNPAAATTYNSTLMQKFMHPFIQLDMRETVAEITIPYLTPAEWFDVKKGFFSWGSVLVDAVTPLRTGASGLNYAEVQIFGYWTEFELAAPSVPQMGKKGTLIREEQESKPGPISQGLRSVSSAARSFAQIPLLSDFATPVAWAADIGSSIASIFGWSKPRVNDQLNLVGRQNMRYANTADGGDCSYPTATVVGNSLSPLTDFSITKEDEMSLAFLYKIPFFYGSIQWATGNAPGTSLLSIPIGPTVLANTGLTVSHNSHTATYSQGAPFWYLSHLFTMWRGDFKVIIKFVKTQYHSGRLQLSWTPGTVFTTAPTLTTGLYSLRQIVDIREQEQIEFNLPYMVYSNYLSTNSFDDHISGNLDILVLNDLRNPETCAGTIDMLVYFVPGDNFEFAAPGSVNSNRLSPFAPQSSDAGVLVSTGIADSRVNRLNIDDARLCIGEMLLSIKQLLNRNSTFVNTTAGTFPPTNTNPVVSFYPYYACLSTINPTTGAITVSGLAGDMYSFLAPMYIFARGGTRISYATPVSTPISIYNTPDMAVINGGNDGTGGLYNQQITGLGNGSFSNAYYQVAFPGGLSNTYTDAGVQTGSVAVPYYSRFPVTLIPPAYGYSISQFAGTYGFTYAKSGVTFCLSSGATWGTSSSQFGRSCADDFQLSLFIGCPGIMTTYV